MGVSRDMPAPRLVYGMPYPYSGSHIGHLRWGRAVGGDADSSIIADDIGAIQIASDAHRLRQSSWARADLRLLGRVVACLAHQFDAGDRFDGAH
ncbi:hypothetical protein AXG53_00190 [Stenotrophomonas sp. KCTC 12332]|nr:hypothetical protein AXG53_00190 [Stenotrophomonas sp. KCTC 12332]